MAFWRRDYTIVCNFATKSRWLAVASDRDVVVGVIGVVIGGYLMSFFGESGITGFNLYSFIVAIIGAVVLLAIVKFVRKN